MDFEYDPDKSASNLAKHGIDFEDAQALWNDARVLEVPARTEEEARILAIGRIGERHWTAVYTPRQGRRRIISVRRSRQEEIDAYEG